MTYDSGACSDRFANPMPTLQNDQERWLLSRISTFKLCTATVLYVRMSVARWCRSLSDRLQLQAQEPGPRQNEGAYVHWAQSLGAHPFTARASQYRVSTLVLPGVTLVDLPRIAPGVTAAADLVPGQAHESKKRTMDAICRQTHNGGHQW